MARGGEHSRAPVDAGLLLPAETTVGDLGPMGARFALSVVDLKWNGPLPLAGESDVTLRDDF
ncbi:hypothetical protein D9M68_795090 [compost metagenome]